MFPSGPCIPRAPTAPCGPTCPVGPTEPANPVGPVLPTGPCGPEAPVASNQHHKDNITKELTLSQTKKVSLMYFVVSHVKDQSGCDQII